MYFLEQTSEHFFFFYNGLPSVFVVYCIKNKAQNLYGGQTFELLENQATMSDNIYTKSVPNCQGTK